MRQLITRVDDSLADAVKERAALTGESVNAFITRLLRGAVADARTWKADAIRAGILVSRAPQQAPAARRTISTPAGYASALVSAERDER